MTSEDEVEAAPSRRMLSWARNSAIYRLERRMMTEKQLFDAIARKAKDKFEDISPSQVKTLAEAAVSFAYEIKALDDTAFAESTTRTAVRNGKSKRAIAQKLSLKGVGKDIVANALEDADDLYAAVVLARKRRFGPFRRDDGFDEKRASKEMSAFARNGYSFELANRILAMDIEDAEDILASR